MPLYDFECSHCRIRFEVKISIHTDSSVWECPMCERVSSKIYHVPQMILTKTTHPRERPQRYPFVDTNITGDPIEITTPNQYVSLMDKYDLSPIQMKGNELGEYRTEKYAKYEEAQRKHIDPSTVKLPARPKRAKRKPSREHERHIEKVVKDVWQSMKTNTPAVAYTA